MNFDFCMAKNKTLLLEDQKESMDSWKLKWSMEEIVLIEDKCVQVLNRLEYPMYGLVSWVIVLSHIT